MVNVFYFLFRVAVNISNSIKSNHFSTVVFNAASHEVKELSGFVWKGSFVDFSGNCVYKKIQ